MTKVNVGRFRKRLLSWFSKHKRLLPWRVDGNPYRILVVEVMLQQTQIKTVIPYYQRWIKAFPNIKALARAPIDRVLKLWEGLGYYARARNLHHAAKIIVRSFGGKIPNTPELLERLPGIGKYTAGAVASIAFQKPVPLVDGNVARVLSRIFYLRRDIAKPQTQKTLYELAKALVPQKDPGTFNQALMELGSLVCLPEMPKCTICPVRKLCRGYKEGNPSRLPLKSKAAKVKKIRMVVGLLDQNGQLLIRKRPDRGIWGGLWEIPGSVCANGQTVERALAQEFQEALGITVRIKKKLPAIEHRFTHRLAQIYPFQVELKGSGLHKFKTRSIRWADRDEIRKFSFPVPHRRILHQQCE